MSEQPRYAQGDVILDNWQIVTPLGIGHSATIYAARSGGSVAALKIMHPRHARRPPLRERFEREARLLIELNHRWLVNVWALDYTERDEPFMIMELLPGQTLHEELEQRERFRPLRALRIFHHLVEVVGFVHEQGIIHRDLKPENVMLLADGRPKLIDFGISKGGAPGAFPTVKGSVLGTPMYMSPEQARGDSAGVDERSDLFTLGLILYQMLSGRTPRRRGALDLMLAEALAPVEPLDHEALRIPKLMVDFVDHLVALDPDRRFDSAAAILNALDNHIVPELEALLLDKEDTGSMSNEDIRAVLEREGDLELQELFSNEPVEEDTAVIDVHALAQLKQASLRVTKPVRPVPITARRLHDEEGEPEVDEANRPTTPAPMKNLPEGALPRREPHALEPPEGEEA